MVSLKEKLEQFLEHQLYMLYWEEDPITVGTSFANAIVMDVRRVSDVIIIIYNDETTRVLDYQVFATCKFDAAGNPPADADESWINILRDVSLTDPLDPASHTQNRFVTIPARTAIVGQNYESFSNKFSHLRVTMKSTAIGSARLWARGSNQH